MDTKKVIVVDETKEDGEILTEEELEEQARQQRLRLLKRPKRNVPSAAGIIINIVIIAGLFGIMLAMLLKSGVILSVSLIVIFFSAVIHYILFK